MKCSFCNRVSDDDMAHLVAGPEGNNICDECQLKISGEMLANYSSLNEPVTCSFCKEKGTEGLNINQLHSMCYYRYPA